MTINKYDNLVCLVCFENKTKELVRETMEGIYLAQKMLIHTRARKLIVRVVILSKILIHQVM